MLLAIVGGVSRALTARVAVMKPRVSGFAGESVMNDVESLKEELLQAIKLRTESLMLTQKLDIIIAKLNKLLGEHLERTA